MKKFKQDLKQSTKKYIEEYKIKYKKETDSGYIFFEEDNKNGNFINESYNSIKNNSEWKNRLNKKHSHFPDENIKEIDSSNSSDALVMNIFCFPDIYNWKGIKTLLNIDIFEEAIFGWNPELKGENFRSPTEIDMMIGNNIFEAKLTESDFTKKEISILRKYKSFDEIFETDLLINNGLVENYQLIRNIIAASENECNFTLLVDSRRTDLIKNFFQTIISIKDIELRKKCNFVTWQEIKEKSGKELKYFLELKYGF